MSVRPPDVRETHVAGAVSNGIDHELVTAFESLGLPLCRTLVEMLNENILHRTERRGCGYTQATRYLAALVSVPELPKQSGGGLFHGNVEPRLGGRTGMLRHIEAISGEVCSSICLPESLILARLIAEIALRNAIGRSLGKSCDEKLPMGTCPLAEQYFLEIAYGFIRRGGCVNVIVDGDRQPVLVEKRGLGDDHSSVSVTPVTLNGVHLPLGSLVGIARDAGSDGDFVATANARGRIIPLGALRAVRFLRLTTLAVAPEHRARTFTAHFEQQIRGELFSPESTRIEQLVDFAVAQST